MCSTMSASCHLDMDHRCLDNVPRIHQRYRKSENNNFRLHDRIVVASIAHAEFGWQIGVAVVVLVVYI